MQWIKQPNQLKKTSKRIACGVNICWSRKEEPGPCTPLCYIRGCATKFNSCGHDFG